MTQGDGPPANRLKGAGVYQVGARRWTMSMLAAFAPVEGAADPRRERPSGYS
jgi:hypothetical protein